MRSISKKEVPDFDSLSDFCWWFLSNGMFFCSPNSDLHTLQISEKSTETIIFRHKRFQVEMYILKESSDFFIEEHSHPNVSTYEYMLIPDVEVDLLPNGSPLKFPSSKEAIKAKVSLKNQPHGGSKSLLNVAGSLLFVFQHWDEGVRMGHISTHNYVGWVLSKKHLEHIKKVLPNVFVEKKVSPSGLTDVYVDTTKQNK